MIVLAFTPRSDSRIGDPARADLARVIGTVCARWDGGNRSRILFHLSLQPVRIAVPRAELLAQAVAALLAGGLSAGPAAGRRNVGVHLWRPAFPPSKAVLMIADDGQHVQPAPCTWETSQAEMLVERAGCLLCFVPSRGAVWRVWIDTACDDPSAFRLPQ